MLSLTYGQLRDSNFARGVMKLVNYPGFKSIKVTHNVAKLNKRLVEETTFSDDLYKKLVEQYAKKEEDGTLSLHDGRPGTFVIPDEVSKVWEEKAREFHAIQFEVDCFRILLSDIEGIKLTPAEVGALEPLLSTLELGASAQ